MVTTQATVQPLPVLELALTIKKLFSPPFAIPALGAAPKTPSLRFCMV